jgi:hypothetical protein
LDELLIAAQNAQQADDQQGIRLRKGKAVFADAKTCSCAPVGEALRSSLRPLFRAVKHHAECDIAKLLDVNPVGSVRHSAALRVA